MTTFDHNWAGPQDWKPRIYRTQSEKDTWYAVTVANEYRLGPLTANDAVVDIGAHIGSFSWLAHLHGSRRIFAYEPDSYNVEGFLENVTGLDGITLFHGAVVRSDARRKPEYRYNGGWDMFGDEGNVVPTRSLDEILSELGPVKFLKIDCEGSEWPILYTCSMLNWVHQIGGEYHANNRFWDESLPPTTIEALAAFLEAQGFVVEHEGAPEIGNFWAIRP